MKRDQFFHSRDGRCVRMVVVMGAWTSVVGGENVRG